ncbi:sugar transferase [Gemella sp. GH3]|uniref:sugar transferase n=1 Tax=unclassified Gemella TaxID=2624949 RepID=UPI0015CFA668|nr:MULTISPECIES: sugar transferase [unclassified Gemella]MBF0713641.1 sugar transferase [Gemella sp. GH3.1]NYS50593.1 sugar transferase [Gemella sp. GH3]
MKNFKELDSKFQNSEVEYYYNILRKKKFSLFIKYIFDRILALILLVFLSPVLIFIAIWIKIDSPGEVFYRQKRVTTYGREFKIYKFRTMVKNADKLGSAVTLQDDPRISKVGKKLRNLRIDELPQLINILLGDMSFVGTRPEVAKYVSRYSREMYATLLLPAGVTSTASIMYKDENEELDKYLLEGMNVDDAYVDKILPEKMKYNLEYLENFSFINDIKIMINTLLGVLK